MDLTHAPIVFLHIPKTAGQTVHNCLSRVVKERRVSPIRVHTQTSLAEDQFPPGYSLYSGHLDWTAINQLPSARYVFTVLRDPGERIASFYFYLRKLAVSLDRATLLMPHNIGLARALDWAAEDYFFGGDDAWQTFVRSHYDNFYCSYFATRRMLGWGETRNFSQEQLLALARTGLSAIDAVFSTDAMDDLEAALEARCGTRLHLANRFDNTSGQPADMPRWPRFLAGFGTDDAARRVHSLAQLDQDLLRRLL